MSNDRCSISYNIKDSQGKVKPSALWEDLTKIFKGDRKNITAHYFLTKDSKFLSENSDVLEFDVDGEVTIASLKKAIERNGEYSDLSNARTLQHLNKEIKAGKYDYSEALDNVLKFNRSHQFREGFMATLKRTSDGKYEISVVERNAASEYELSEHVMNKIVTDSIRLLLKDRGLSIDFLDKPAYASKFSTNNVHMDADGLMAIAQVLNGVNSSKDVAEVAGHFIVAAMKENPLIERLISQLTPEVQLSIFKDKKSDLFRDDFNVSDYSAVEAAGILIGHQLLQPFEKAKRTKTAIIGQAIRQGLYIPKGIKFVLSRVISAIRNLFNRDTPESVSIMVDNAKEAAATAAQGFLTNPNSADVNQALANKRTFTHYRLSEYLSDSVRESVGVYNNVLNELKTTMAELRTSIGRTDNPLNKDIYKKLHELTDQVEEYSSQFRLETYAREASVAGMVMALDGIVKILDTDVRDLLDSIQPSDRTTSYYKQVSNSHNMRTLNTTVIRIGRIYKQINDNIDHLNATMSRQYQDNEGNQVVGSLQSAMDRLATLLTGTKESYTDNHGIEHTANGLGGLMEIKRRQMFIDFYKNFYGADFIELNCGKVFRQKGKWFTLTTLKESEKRKSVEDMVKTLESDISIFDRFMGSAADCADFITAVGHKVTNQANMQADRRTARYWDSIEELRLQMQEVFGTTDCRMLYEVIDDKTDYGDWNEAKKKFLESLKYATKADKDTELAEWHKRNSEVHYDSEGKKVYVPNKSLYTNNELEGRKILTGNLITRVNYGAWEKARSDFKHQLKVDFYNYLAEYRQRAYENNKHIPGYVFELTDEQQGVLYHQFVEPLWKQWHAENSEVDPSSPDSKRMVPNHVKYYNAQWDELFDTDNPTLTSEEKKERKRRLNWYNSLLSLKAEMDSLLPTNSTITHRAPQMTGRMSHRFRNLRMLKKNGALALGRAARRTIQDNFAIRPDEAWMFGTENNYSEISEDPLENPTFFEKEKIDRLPMFGINKLKNMEELSTDLFGTLLQYGSMAAVYKSMEQVVDVFELGKDVLKERKVGSEEEKNRKKGSSKAYNRYIKFVDKDVYGLNITPPIWDRNGVLRKFANTLSSIGSRILLAGNLHGGIVNTGTGLIEILKESIAGENFTYAERNEAIKMYFDGLLSPSDGYLGTFLNGITDEQRPMDKNSLWIRHWNILSENRSFYRNQKYDTGGWNPIDWRFWEWTNHILMLPYSSGDHMMQTIPYYAMGIHEKVYTKDGKKINLMDAYDIVDGEEVYAIGDTEKNDKLGNTPKKLKLKEGIFKTLADIDKYELNQQMQRKIADFFANSSASNGSQPVPLNRFTEEEKQYIMDEGLGTVTKIGEDEVFVVPTTVKQLESLGNALISKANEHLYNESDESAFMDKCRNICNRMHGIYNSEDKVALQQTFYGNLLMSMRGYALGMVNRRFSRSSFNVPQNKVVEGSYNTLAKVIFSAFTDFNNMDNWRAVGDAMFMMTPFLNFYGLFSEKFGDRMKANMIQAKFSEHQYYNMRRNAADITAITSLFFLRLFASPGSHLGLSDDGDEDGNKKVDTPENWLYGLLYYFSNRWFIEQSAFSLPTSMLTESMTLTDIVPAGLSGLLSVLDIGKLMLETQIDKIGGADKDNSKYYYQQSKDGKYKVGDEKWFKKAQRLMPYWRSWYTFSNPYGATSDYEYGRKMK